MHGMYVCTPQLAGGNPLVGPISLIPLVKVRGSSPRRGSSPLLTVPTPEGWKAEYTLASRMQIHESLTVLALVTRGEARTSDPWICSLMLYHLSYLTTYIQTYIHTYIHTELRKGYCQNVRPTVQRIKLEHFNKINDNLKDGNSPGRDLIVGYWIKKNISLRQPTFDIYQNINNNNYNLPEWLVKTRTTLLPKNEQTHDPKNYRPIACENLMMKVYTGCIASLLEEHCTENNIIYPEQAGAKKGMGAALISS